MEDATGSGTAEYMTMGACGVAPGEFPAMTREEVARRCVASGFRRGAIYVCDGETFDEATPEQAARVWAEKVGARPGELYQVRSEGMDASLSPIPSTVLEGMESKAEACKRAATDVQRAAVGLMWAVRRFARECSGGSPEAVLALESICKAIDQRSGDSGARASEVIERLASFSNAR